MPVPVPILPRLYYPRAVVVLDLVVNAVQQPPITLSPKTMRIERNDARHADTASITLDWKDLPVDLRTITSAQVSVHIEDALQSDLPTIPSPLNLRFIGLADEITQSVGKTVKISARDFTGIFIDYKWNAPIPPPVPPPSPLPFPIPTQQNLVAAIDSIRAFIAPLTLPTIAKDPSAYGAVLWNACAGKLTVPSVKQDESAWDLMCRICGLFGMVPVWNLDQLEIRPPAFPSGAPAVWIYGDNVDTLEIKRDYREHRSKPVQVVAWNPATGVALTARYPTPEQAAKHPRMRLKPTASKKPTQTLHSEYVQYDLVGAYTPVDLTLIAKAIYDELSSGDVSGRLETKELYDWIGIPVLGLSNGDIIDVRVNAELRDQISGMSQAEQVLYLSDPFRPNALNPAVATALVASWWTAQAIGTVFYVKSAIHEWDRESGYKLSIDFVSFILG